MRFSRKPAVIEAVAFTGSNLLEVRSFLAPRCVWAYSDGAVTILTSRGQERLSAGHWVVRGHDGQISVCGPDALTEAYQPCGDGP